MDDSAASFPRFTEGHTFRWWRESHVLRGLCPKLRLNMSCMGDMRHSGTNLSLLLALM
jgi:hypothetical protein